MNNHKYLQFIHGSATKYSENQQVAVRGEYQCTPPPHENIMPS